VKSGKTVAGGMPLGKPGVKFNADKSGRMTVAGAFAKEIYPIWWR